MDSLSEHIIQIDEFPFSSTTEPWRSRAEFIRSLFEEHRESMFRYLMLMTRDTAISEDLVQESFLRLHREIIGGAKLENPRAWLYSVAHHLAIDQGRRTKPSAADPADTEVEATTSNPEEMAIEQQRWVQLDEAVRNLSAVQQQCLFLRREGFQYRKIAQILNIGETTVIDHLRRGIQRLQKELKVDTSSR